MQSAKKEEHTHRDDDDDDDDDDVFSNRIGNRIVARRLPKKSNAFSPSFVDLASKKKATAAFFSPDEFSQKDLFVRVERLLFGKREREGLTSARQIERSKKTLVVVVVTHRSHTKKKRRRVCKKKRTLMISDNSWLISAWNANVSVSASSPMIDCDGSVCVCVSFVSVSMNE